MKKTLIVLAGVTFALFALVKCTKQNEVNADGIASGTTENLAPVPNGDNATSAPACVPVYWDLAVIPGGGASLVYKISGTPSCGPVAVTSLGQVKCGGAAVTFMTGLSYDPASGTFFGTTGPASVPANSLIKFTAATIGTASCVPLVNTCGIILNVSDIERNQVTGVYYAINRSTVAASHRVVTINVGTAQVGCLPCTISLNYNPRGLTFDCSGTMWLMSTAGQNGTLIKTDPNGCTGALCAYPGVVTPPPAVAVPEIGLHYDCCCNRFVTGNYDPVGPAPILTDGISICFAPPAYNFIAGAIRPTVDFAR